MYDKVGFVAEVTEGFCQKAEVAVPEKLVRANGEVGVEKDFQASGTRPRGEIKAVRQKKTGKRSEPSLNC